MVVILFGLFISISPFLPEVTLRWKKFRDTTGGVPYSGALASTAPQSDRTNPPNENRLVIPSINLNEKILEGNSIGVINKGGTWRRPKSSKPGESGNSVIVGHRIYGSNASTLYHLDSVQIGQKFAVYWQGRELLYEVAQKKVVPATAVEIEAQTDTEQLTIYTCTPIWTAKDRLVVVANRIEQL
jgi:sortase A